MQFSSSTCSLSQPKVCRRVQGFTESVNRKAVKEQQMMWMAIKSLQEAMARIETLEAELAALKGS